MSMCKACKFYCDGLCRRNPPVVLALTSHYDEGNQTIPETHFPSVLPDDWCGEFVESLKESPKSQNNN